MNIDLHDDLRRLLNAGYTTQVINRKFGDLIKAGWNAKQIADWHYEELNEHDEIEEKFPDDEI